MFISIPRDFFVPVVFSDDFRYNSENDCMEYDTDLSNSKYNINRRMLMDLNSEGNSREDSGFIAEEMENLININDKKIEEQTSNYSKSFMKFIEELKEEGCLDKNGVNIKTLVNYYAKSFRELYNSYKDLISNVTMPISSSDEDQIIDEYIGKLEDIYNKNLKELNCKNLTYDYIEPTLNEIFDNAREILKEEIRNINCDLVNIRSVCNKPEVIRNEFNKNENIYNKLDDEFVMEMQK